MRESSSDEDEDEASQAEVCYSKLHVHLRYRLCVCVVSASLPLPSRPADCRASFWVSGLDLAIQPEDLERVFSPFGQV